MLNSDLWSSAICGSFYFELVLNIKVPTMTSNTDPEGEAIQYIQSDLNETVQAYKAFNNTIWASGWSMSKHCTPCGVGYKFTSPIKIYKFYFKAQYSEGLRVKNYIIQASNDGLNWIDLFSGITENSSDKTEYSYSLSNKNKYLYYRIYCTSDHWADWRGATIIETLQFYGRI